MDKSNSSSARTLMNVQTACLFLIAAVAVGFAAAALREVLVPFVLALFFATCLAPLIDVLKAQLKVPHGIAVVLCFLFGFAVLGGVGLILASVASDVASQQSVYAEQLTKLQNDVLGALPLDSFGMTQAEAEAKIAGLVDSFGKSAMGAIGGLLGTLLSQGMMVLLYMVFLMIGHTTYTPKKDSGGTLQDEIAWQVESYVLIKLGISAVTGIFTWVILGILGVDFALVFGMLAFFLNFIPSLGSAIAVVLPLPIMLIDPDLGMVSIILGIALPAAVQGVMGNVLEPKLLGKSMDLHPVALLFGLVFFSLIWGIVGALLATPLMAVAKILLMRSSYTERLGALLADTGSETKNILKGEQEAEAKKAPKPSTKQSPNDS